MITVPAFQGKSKNRKKLRLKPAGNPKARFADFLEATI